MPIGFLCALALVIVLVGSAVLKLKDLPAVATNFAALGLPRPRILSRLVPGAELLVAVGLLAEPAWGGVAAFGLLAAFSAVLISVLRSGAVVACNCFGSLSQAPVSLVHLLRNIGLMALAIGAAILG